jgi:hypothetical protein
MNTGSVELEQTVGAAPDECVLVRELKGGGIRAYLPGLAEHLHVIYPSHGLIR